MRLHQLFARDLSPGSSNFCPSPMSTPMIGGNRMRGGLEVVDCTVLSHLTYEGVGVFPPGAAAAFF